MKEEKLLLIDGFNLLSRGYFATAYNRTEEQLSKSSSGLYTNALRVFFQKMFNLIDERDVTHMAVAWDIKREETERRMKYDFYKATRGELPPPLIEQYETLTTVLEQLDVQQFTIPPHEADDVIGSLSAKWDEEKESACYIYSNDKDFLQLLSETTSQIIAQRKGEQLYTKALFNEEYGIEPKQWIDVKALLGDTSDNIPGCPGVGQKSALPLIQDYQSIEQLFSQLDELDKKYNRYKKKLVSGQELTIISKELATINRDVPEVVEMDLDDLSVRIDKDKVTNAMGELDLKIKLT